MLALASLFITLVLSLLCIRVVTVALILTGLSHEAAQFQASSAFTGVGFTTSEAEQIVNHPVRRRIILLTMRLGGVGVVTAISSLILTFVEAGETRTILTRLSVLLLGLTLLWLLATSSWIDYRLSRLISWALRHGWSDLNVRDYASLLRLSGDYRVIEIQVQPGDWLANKNLAELNLSQEGILVLGISRANGHYVGAPTGETLVHPDDTLILYGRSPELADLDIRRAGPTGDMAHEEAILNQEKLLVEQAKEDSQS